MQPTQTTNSSPFLKETAIKYGIDPMDPNYTAKLKFATQTELSPANKQNIPNVALSSGQQSNINRDIGYANDIRGVLGMSPVSVRTGLPVTPNGNIKTPVSTTPTTSTTSTLPTTSTTPTISTPAAGQITTPTGTGVTNNAGSTGISTQATEPKFNIDTSNVTSGNIAPGTTYGDILKRRQTLEDQYAKAYQDYAQAKTAENLSALQNKASEYGAAYGTQDISANAALLNQQQMQNVIKQIGAETRTQGALLAAQGVGNLIGYTQQDISNQLAAQATTDGYQVTPAGDVIGYQRNPTTGAVAPLNMGNIYTGTYAPKTGTAGGMLSSVGTSMTSNQQPLTSQFSSLHDGRYINENDVPAALMTAVKIQAAQDGVRVLPETDVKKVQDIETTADNLNQMQSVSEKILGSGITGRATDTIKTVWNSYAQTNPDIASFDAWRTTAINVIQGLAGGAGSGMRLNGAEITNAVSSLPTSSDNIETANAKLKIVRGYLEKWHSEVLPGQAWTATTQAPTNPNSPANAPQSSAPVNTWDNII